MADIAVTNAEAEAGGKALRERQMAGRFTRDWRVEQFDHLEEVEIAEVDPTIADRS